MRPFYLAKVVQPGECQEPLHDSITVFVAAFHRFLHNLGIPRKQRWNFLAYTPLVATY